MIYILASYLKKELIRLSFTCASELSPFYIQCYRTSPLPPGTHTLVLVQKTDKMVSNACDLSWPTLCGACNI